MTKQSPKPDPMAEDELDRLLLKYQAEYGNTITDWKDKERANEPDYDDEIVVPELKQAINVYTTNKIILELEEFSEVIFELFNNNDLEDEQIDNELLQSVIKTHIAKYQALNHRKEAVHDNSN